MPAIFDGLGVEQLADEIEDALRDKLNDQLTVTEATWEPIDRARATRRQQRYIPVTLDPVLPDAFYFGSLPSLMAGDDLSPNDFPYVAVTVEDISPHPEDSVSDHLNVFLGTMTVHGLAKADTTEGRNIAAELVVRRALRMSEAIYAVISSSLSRRLAGLSNPQRVRASEPFVFNPEGREDTEWFWSAAFTQWGIRNYTQVSS